MEITLTQEQEDTLRNIAADFHKDPATLAREFLVKALEERAQFILSIKKSIASYESGKFIEEEEMDALIERNFDRE